MLNDLQDFNMLDEKPTCLLNKMKNTIVYYIEY